MNDKQLPPLPTPKFTETIRGVPCITLTEHEHLMRTYALQARAQVQGEAFGYIHHFTAHDESGALIDTTWEADGCADPLPHPTFPSMWKWAHCTPFYTTPQPAQFTQAEVTDDVSLDEQFHDWIGTIKDAHDESLNDEHASSRSMLRGVIYEMEEARTTISMRSAQVPMTYGEILHQLNKISDRMGSVVRLPKGWLKFARAIEEWHGITAQAKKETP